jgi:hypothetical protein
MAMTKASKWKTAKESEAQRLKGFTVQLTIEPTLRAVRKT